MFISGLWHFQNSFDFSRIWVHAIFWNYISHACHWIDFEQYLVFESLSLSLSAPPPLSLSLAVSKEMAPEAKNYSIFQSVDISLFNISTWYPCITSIAYKNVDQWKQPTLISGRTFNELDYENKQFLDQQLEDHTNIYQMSFVFNSKWRTQFSTSRTLTLPLLQ